MQPNEQRVREFAHQIWESEGKPDGQASRHWEMACKLAAGETGPADPFEPLTNINTFVEPSPKQATQGTPSTTTAPAKRTRVKAVIDDPDAAPKKASSRSRKKAVQDE